VQGQDRPGRLSGEQAELFLGRTHGIIPSAFPKKFARKH